MVGRGTSTCLRRQLWHGNYYRVPIAWKDERTESKPEAELEAGQVDDTTVAAFFGVVAVITGGAEW